MNFDIRFAYLALGGALLLVWLALYVGFPRVRREQLRISLLFSPLGTLAGVSYLQDYWRPVSLLSIQLGGMRIMAEDFLFTFTLTGIAAILPRLFSQPRAKRPSNKAALLAFLLMFALFIVFFRSGLNSIYAASCACLIAGIVLALRDRTLWPSLWIAASLTALLMTVVYATGFSLFKNSEDVLRTIWLLYGTPLGQRFVGVPLTEIVWAFSFGAFMGPLAGTMRLSSDT